MKIHLNRRNGFRSSSQRRLSRSWSVFYNTEPGPSLGSSLISWWTIRGETKDTFSKKPDSLHGGKLSRPSTWALGMVSDGQEKPQSNQRTRLRSWCSATGCGVSKVRSTWAGTLLDAFGPSVLFTLFSLSMQVTRTWGTVVQGLSRAPRWAWWRGWVHEDTPKP